MAILKDILYKTSLVSTAGSMDREISHIAFDSRKVMENTLFIAVSGTQVDGHDFIDQAISSGADVVVCERMPQNMREGITYVSVKDSSQALGFIASNFYGNPSAKLRLVGVTGTNGKTTVATLLHKLFRGLGHNTGLLSTVVNKINEEEIPSSHTTPDAISLNALLHDMVEQGCKYAFMEVSSHAIEQNRVAGQQFAGALFTNISHDHLDYHKTFDAYISAKKKLFDGLSAESFALTNVDDKRGSVMLQNTKAKKQSYALKRVADFKGKLISNTLQGLEMEIDNNADVWFRLIGDFNAYNLLAVYATAILLGEPKEEVLTKMSALEGAPGRFEQVPSNSNITAIVDYAHTPDALKNVLETIAEFRGEARQVITVVGCGGNRDREKRPVMASIACKWSDKVILTSDNPRNEDPMDILKDMQAGVSVAEVKKTIVQPDREEAIKMACMLAEENDIVLVAGKGHETYQEIKGVKHPFDDKEVLKRMLNLFAKE